jgi:hypothetical protein
MTTSQQQQEWCRTMLNPFQVFVGTVKRYFKKPKSVEFYWNTLAISVFGTFAIFSIFDQDFFSNVFPKKIEQEGEKKE